MANPDSDQKAHPVFSSFFEDLKDPRRTSKGNHLYPLEEILFLCISAVISRSDSWVSIQDFGTCKLNWLRQYYPFSNGIPSHDVLGKVFAALDPAVFGQCFIAWANSIASACPDRVVAVDGKTICGSADPSRGKSALHIVSAYASAQGLCLGQVATDEKSNEITAIPELLELLAIKGSIITIDAMGCQKKIAQTIIEKDANYVLMVKGNQKGLKEQVEKVFSLAPVKSENQAHDLGHGRMEHRKCEVIDELQFLDDCPDWPGLKSIVRITSQRAGKKTGKESTELRYYISSLKPDASLISQAVRDHWAIENKLHWSLDVVFKEDASLKKNGHSPRNYNIIAKMALTLIDREKSTKKSKPSKRTRAALDDKYRDKILGV